MSPASAADGATRKPQAWTETAKLQLLMRINSQLREGGKAIDWTKINMPGRTPKSLQNTWFSIKKAIAEMEENEKAGGVALDNGSGSRSPAKTATPRKRLPDKRPPVKRKATPFQEAQDDDDDDDEDKDPPKKATPMKRKAESTADENEKKLKCLIKHDPDDGDTKEDYLKDYIHEM
ncbi:hypothetical protein E4U21_004564 [Claviceps maximensis]|nr:hypothetical protein E4U21_004564 [Claviceps maximensis]